MLKPVLLVAAGGAFGSVCRYLVGVCALRWFGAGFPIGTLAVNVAGSFAMGVLVEVLARRAGDSNDLRLLLATGVLGGFTTFSSFSLDAAALWQKGSGWIAFAYVAASLAAGIGGLFAGFGLARHLG